MSQRSRAWLAFPGDAENRAGSVRVIPSTVSRPSQLQPEIRPELGEDLAFIRPTNGSLHCGFQEAPLT
jgi:hypothetical protein